MRKKGLRSLSVILSIAMLMGSISLPVNAAEVGDYETVIETVSESADSSEVETAIAVVGIDEDSEEKEAESEDYSEESSEESSEDESVAEIEVVTDDETVTEEVTEVSLEGNEGEGYEVSFYLNGEKYRGEIESDGNGIDWGTLRTTGDDVYVNFPDIGERVITNVEYTIGATTKNCDIRVLQSLGNFYFIPKEEITRDIAINVVTRELYTDIPVNFNEGDNCHFSVSVDEQEKGYYKVSEHDLISFSVLPDEGYKLVAVTPSMGDIVCNLDKKACTFILDECPGEKPESIDINVVVVLQKVNKVVYDPDAVDVTVAEKSNPANIVEATSVSGKDSSGRVTGSYWLSADTEYKLTIACKEGYSFNENGVGKAMLNADGNQTGTATLTNKNTKNAYTCDIKDGSFIFDSNTKALFSPVIKVNGEAITPVNGIYSVDYLNTLNVSVMKGNSEETATLVLFDGTKEIGRSEDGSLTFGATAYGKTLNAKMYAEGVDKPVAEFKIAVSTPITSVTVTGVKLINKVQTLSPVIGKSVTCNLAVNKGASLDDLDFKVSENDFLEVSIDNGKLVVTADGKKKAGDSATITLYDKKNAAVAWNEQNIKNGTIVVTTATPAWVKTAPTASLVTASDVVLDFNVTEPKGLELSDYFYVAVKLAGNAKTKTPEYLTVNDTVKYYRVTDGKIPAISVNAFKNDGSEVSELGNGCGTSLDANIYLVLTSDGETPSDSNIIETTATKKITVATKAPYYADKISLKKGTTTLYAGQSGIKIADIVLGAKTSYNTTDYWMVKSVVDANGKDVSSKIRLKTGIGAGKSVADTGIYAVLDEQTPAGKYKVTVKTLDGFYAPEVSIDITVLPTIYDLSLSSVEVYGDGSYCYIVKEAGKAASAKTTLVAKDQSGAVIKAPKVKYEIGKYVNGEAEPVAGLTVNNKGVISVAKTFVPSSDDAYLMIVKAADYQGSVCRASVMIDFETGNYGINAFDVYAENGHGFDKVTGQTITADMDLYIYAEDGNGNSIIGSKRPNGLIDPVDISYYVDGWESIPEKYRIEGLVEPSKVTKAGTYKFTLFCVDGTKATASFGIDYVSNNEGYCSIIVKDDEGKSYKTSDGNVINIDKNKTDDSQGRVAAPNDVISVSIDILDGGYGIDNSYRFVEGSLSVTGAKVVQSDARKQCLKIVLTKPEAKVTLTKKLTNETTGKLETKKFTWTIKNSAIAKAKAPAVSKVQIHSHKGDEEPNIQMVYADYSYSSKGDSSMLIILKEPLKDSDGNRIISSDSYNVGVELSGCEELESMIIKDEENEPYYIGYRENNKYYVFVSIPLKDNFRLSAKKYSFNINYKDSEGNYLTSTPTTVTINPAKLNKSFAVNATQTMSVKDGYVIDIATKSSGVEKVEYLELYNYNKAGKYNNFSDLYRLDDNRLAANNIEAIFDEANVDKKGIPLPMDGYINCKVTYESGEVAYLTNKITVKWNTAQVGKYTMVKDDLSVSATNNYFSVQIKDASNNVLGHKGAKLAGLKGDSPAIKSVFRYGDGPLCCQMVAGTKPGTYKSTALVILADSKCPHSPDEITDEDFSKYGVRVQVTITVVAD